MTEPIVTTRHPWTVRLAGWSARHRWPVVAVWFVLTIGLFVASLLAGGTNSAEAVSSDDTPKYESGEAYDLFGRSGPEGPPSQQLLVVIAADGVTLDDPGFAAAIDDAVSRLSAAHATVNGADTAALDQVIDPRAAPPEQGLVAPDRSAARVVARVPGEGQEVEQRLVPIRPLMDALRADHPGFEIHALNGTMANDDIQELVNGGLDASLRLTIPLTFAILVIAFGAVVAAFVPLVLAVTALLAAFGILGLYSQIVGPVSPYAGQLVVLIGLAVAVDYSLFMVSRFRTERRHGRDKLAAIGVASSTAGRAVFFSGLAVMISVAGLFMLDDPLFRSMAIGTIAVVLVSVVGSLTFLRRPWPSSATA
jgi:RND superfamily putative drug exporter